VTGDEAAVEAGIGLADVAAQDQDRGLQRAKKVVVESGHVTLAVDVAIGLGTDVEIGRHPPIHPGRQDQHRHGQHHPQRQAGVARQNPPKNQLLMRRTRPWHRP